MSQQFCLKWNNHMNNMMEVFKNLLSTEAMVDVTLACDGLSLKAHKIVLSACSPFFQALFLENPCKHPIVILKDMKYSELKAIIEFMYHGEVNVAQDQLSALMKTAETLRVKGLAETTNEKSSSVPQDDTGHRSSVPRTDTPPPKRRRGRTRKRSLSDSNRSDDESEPKIKQPDSPEIEELSDVTIDTSAQYSNMQSQVPLSSHSTNTFHKSSISHEPQIEEPVSADESFTTEEKFGVEPSKLLEQTLTTDDLPNRRSGRSSVSSNMEMQRRPRSTDHSMSVPTPAQSEISNQQPESPPDIKPELLELEPAMSPVAGPSHSTDNSMMMFMDQSNLSVPGPSGYQDNSQALVPQDSSTPQEKLESILWQSICPSKDPLELQKNQDSIKNSSHGCPLCSCFSNYKLNLSRHLLEHTTEKPYSCPCCMKTHPQNAHNNMGEKPHKCAFCKKAFARNAHLKEHILTHTGEKPYTCEICTKAFSRNTHLRRHLRTHTGEKPYKCNVCEERFAMSESLRKHEKSHIAKMP